MKAEDRIQQLAVEWFRNNYCLKHHKPRYRIFSVLNEGKDKKEQGRKISIGLDSGVSDTVIVLDSKTLFAECKTPTGSQSDAQIDFEQSVTELGHTYFVFRSLEEFQKKVLSEMQSN